MSDTKSNITFYSKQAVQCPACQAKIKKEELLSGGGRLNASDLTDELRRLYTPSPKYGAIFPFMYSIGTCPNCYLSLFWNDFAQLGKSDADKIFDVNEDFYKEATAIFPYAEFNRSRTIIDGAAAMYMAMMFYGIINKDLSPSIKSGILSLRLAWLCGELDKIVQNRNYDYIQQQFYAKALFYYNHALKSEATGTEKISNITSFGPDVDKNYGFDGVIYLAGALEYKYGQTEDMEQRLKKIDEHKRSLARVFGFGKTNKQKPGPFLEVARAKYELYIKTLKEANRPDAEELDEE